jgi:hypothetical protein
VVLGETTPGSSSGSTPFTLGQVTADNDFHIVTADGLKLTAQQASQVPIDNRAIAVTGASSATIKFRDGTVIIVPPNSRMPLQPPQRLGDFATSRADTDQTPASQSTPNACPRNRTKPANAFIDVRVVPKDGKYFRVEEEISLEDSDGQTIPLSHTPAADISEIFNTQKLSDAASYVSTWQKTHREENGFLINPKLPDGYEFLPPFAAQENGIPLKLPLPDGTTYWVHTHPNSSLPSFADLVAVRDAQKPGIILRKDECIVFDVINIRKVLGDDGQAKYQLKDYPSGTVRYVVNSEHETELTSPADIAEAQQEAASTLSGP